MRYDLPGETAGAFRGASCLLMRLKLGRPPLGFLGNMFGAPGRLLCGRKEVEAAAGLGAGPAAFGNGDAERRLYSFSSSLRTSWGRA